jgi:hypothetical protein
LTLAMVVAALLAMDALDGLLGGSPGGPLGGLAGLRSQRPLGIGYVVGAAVVGDGAAACRHARRPRVEVGTGPSSSRK